MTYTNNFKGCQSLKIGEIKDKKIRKLAVETFAPAMGLCAIANSSKIINTYLRVFDWKSTPQGFDYWQSVYDRFASVKKSPVQPTERDDGFLYVFSKCSEI